MSYIQEDRVDHPKPDVYLFFTRVEKVLHRSNLMRRVSRGTCGFTRLDRWVSRPARRDVRRSFASDPNGAFGRDERRPLVTRSIFVRLVTS